MMRQVRCGIGGPIFLEGGLRRRRFRFVMLACFFLGPCRDCAGRIWKVHTRSMLTLSKKELRKDHEGSVPAL